MPRQGRGTRGLHLKIRIRLETPFRIRVREEEGLAGREQSRAQLRGDGAIGVC